VLVLWHQPWMIPLAAITAAAGLAQPIWMVFTALRRRVGGYAAEWRRLRLLMVATILLVYGSYFFSVRGPQVHSFYLLLPLAMMFAATCWQVRAEARGGRMRGLERLAAVVIVSSVMVHAGLAVYRWPRLSMYSNRPLVAAAIADRTDRYLGDRRDSLTESRDRDGDPPAFRTADPIADLEVVRSQLVPLIDRFSSLDVTIANRSAIAAWVDIRYETTYTGANGERLTVRNGVIKQILQPGETRTFDRIADGDLPPGAQSATVTIAGAEHVIPRRVGTP
jgi:hypothetical protein